MQPLLELREVSKSFGGIEVFTDISLELAAGTRLGVLGPNGAGKSTMFNLISGLHRPSGGKMIYQGQDLTTMKPWTVCRAGIGRTFQIPQPFVDMTVLDNIIVGCTAGAGLNLHEARDRATEILDLTGLGDHAGKLARDLGLLDLKRLELAKAAAMKPKLLLLDEIAGGLTEAECGTLLDILNHVTGRDTAVIWIEHVVHALTQFVDEIAVLADKRIITRGEIDTVLANDEVRQLYFGAEEEV
ncbi:ABC transporter ATP-binding protein [Pseudodonghicola flavimaris]|uniref:ATP-binding cassette domain-containing protein n=1 Tax=Pseudodonghicola flavimaris TaxID=3050036 RepID=A0ABT7F579_9RHOB|nr:ATP-binding cassette domain-containing protein [Pseudodonghicola flavimaris]MDK3019757.1 ATP-binding cassette domain-containing protein [Pseudodonghicola flavimaris]